MCYDVSLDFIFFLILCMQAYNESINMQANSYFVPEATNTEYLNYGAAVSEVTFIDLFFMNVELFRDN